MNRGNSKQLHILQEMDQRINTIASGSAKA